MNYNAADNSFKSYELAIAALREAGVRDGKYAPINAVERRWASEGSVPVSALESVAPPVQEAMAL